MNLFVILLVWTVESPIPVMVIDEADLTSASECLSKASRAEARMPLFEKMLEKEGLVAEHTEALCVSM